MVRSIRAHAGVAALLLVASLFRGIPAAGAEETPARPNVLLIVSDDQPTSLFTRTYMPSVFDQIVDQGINFERAYVSSSVCCPSRAHLLTGLH